jgi:integrase
MIHDGNDSSYEAGGTLPAQPVSPLFHVASHSAARISRAGRAWLARIVGFFHEPEEGLCPSYCSTALVDVDRRRRCRDGHDPGNKGLRYPADPPKVEEIIAVMRAAGDSPHGRRLRGLIVVLWRAGLRIQEALALTEGDLDHRRGALLVRRGKRGRRREVGMARGAGSNSGRGSTCGASSRSVRCSASSTARRGVASG